MLRFSLFCYIRPKRAKRAAGEFNSSPVLGEVPQAEGDMTAITLLHFRRFMPLWAFLLVSPGVSLAAVSFGRLGHFALSFFFFCYKDPKGRKGFC